MSTATLLPILAEVLTTLNTDVTDEEELAVLLKQSYNGSNTLAEGTRILINGLFGSYGLIVLDPDHAALKQLFKPVMQQELLTQSSQSVVLKSTALLALHYKVQANPRPINLFYMKDQLRERIVFNDSQWSVTNTELVFDEAGILHELENYPERFSPNVILRPLYQETILPNIAFVGGGGELAYWLELKALFDFHAKQFPILFLRNSVSWFMPSLTQRMQKLSLKLFDAFRSKDLLMQEKIMDSAAIVRLDEISSQLGQVYLSFKTLGAAISPQLEKSMIAHIARMKKVEDRIHQKTKAVLKRNETSLSEQIDRMQQEVFPNGQLQERYENFLTLFKDLGFDMFDLLLEHQQPFGKDFLILSIS